MADDAAIRLANFKRLFGEPFSPSEAARRLWGTPSQWSDLARGQKAFGEKLARKIEERLGLTRMSLDDPGGPAAMPLSADLMRALEQAPEEDGAGLRTCCASTSACRYWPQAQASFLGNVALRRDFGPDSLSKVWRSTPSIKLMMGGPVSKWREKY